MVATQGGALCTETLGARAYYRPCDILAQMHLDEETPLILERVDDARVAAAPRWETLKLGVMSRLGMVLRPGDAIVFPEIVATRAAVALLTLGATRQDAAFALHVDVRWRSSQQGRRKPHDVLLTRIALGELERDEPWLSYQFPLRRAGDSRGSVVLSVARAWTPRRSAVDLVLYDLAVSDAATLDLERARSFRSLRIRNERANFDAYYQHEIFQHDGNHPPAATAPDIAGDSGTASSSPLAPPAQEPPTPAFLYSRSELARKIALNPPAFGQRLHAKVDRTLGANRGRAGSRIRVLSLCSGAARIEAGLVRQLPHEAVSLTLLDVNEDLLALARRTLAAWGPIETVVADVNDLDLRDERFDVIIAVSALHHVLELEHVIEQVSRALTEDGEFWSIGETLGRNGGRMFAEPYKIANEFFTGLEPAYRRNRMTGGIDTTLPDLDYSIGCFEGIRCEAIEPTLLRFLAPVHVTKHNCIVHKLFSLSYSDNYDMALDKDRALVDAAVDLDVALHSRGFGIELHGVYRAST